MQPDENNFIQKIEELAERDGRFKREAYLFIYASLEYIVRKLKRDRAETAQGRHVSGQELAQGIAEYVVDQYGPLAGPVLKYWGIRCTLDMGSIVFNLVDEGLMSKTEEDSVEDFRDVYDFDERFEPKRIQRSRAKLTTERL